MQSPTPLQNHDITCPESDEEDDTREAYVVTYQRTSNENPFLDQPKSGSSWGKIELDWLKAEFHGGLAPEYLSGPSTNTPGDVEVLSLLSQWMNVGWADVKNGNFDRDLSLFYENLRDLSHFPVNIYASSSPQVVHTPSQSPLPAMDQIRSSQSDPSPSRNTPRQKPQLESEQTPSQPIPSSPPLRQSEQSSPTLPTPCTPRTTTRAEIHPVTSSVHDSDSTFIPSSPFTISSNLASSCYDKPELDVVAAARGFLQLLKQADLRSDRRISGIGVHVQSSQQLKMLVDGSAVSTTSDLSFSNTTTKGRLLFRLLNECKRQEHKLSVHDIRGQEVCHLLAQAQQYFNVYPRWKSCRVHLLAWHHLTAYILRADVTASYLDQLATNSKDIVESLLIETSVPFSIKSPSERTNLAHTLIKISRQEAGTSS